MDDVLRAPCPCPDCQTTGKFLGASALYQHVVRNDLANCSIPCPCVQCKGIARPFATTLWHLRRRNVLPDAGPAEDHRVGWEAGLEMPDIFFDGVLDVSSDSDVAVSSDEEEEGPDHFPWEAPQPEPDEVQFAATLKLFAMQICDAVGSNVLSQQGANTVLKILDSTVSKFLPDYIRLGLPRNFIKLQKIAGVRYAPHILRHLCPRRTKNKKFLDHHMFPADDDDPTCPKCSAATRYLPGTSHRPARQVIYYDVAYYVRSLYEVPETRDYLLNWQQQLLAPVEGTITNPYDASHLRALYAKHVPPGVICLPLAQCNDATQIERMSGASLTPVLCECLAFPEHLRHIFGNMFLAALLPRRANNDQLMLTPWVEQLARYAPGNEAIEVEIPDGDALRVHIILSHLINDLRGFPKTILAKQSPAYFGACIQCNVAGIKCTEISTTIYPGVSSSGVVYVVVLSLVRPQSL